jgi:putative ABC transport system permease protein
MNALAFAWRSLRRQPARAVLGVIGVAAVGALLFDMLLLSHGLMISMKDLLDRAGFDVRITATPTLPGSGPRIRNARSTAAAIARLPQVEEAVALRLGEAEFVVHTATPRSFGSFFGVNNSRRRLWTILEGRDIASVAGKTETVLINRALADQAKLRVGDSLSLRASCGASNSALPPARFRIVGIAQFPFQTATELSAATTLDDFASACGEHDRGEADLILVAARTPGGPDVARDAVSRLRPDLHVMTNQQVVGRLQQAGFSYFQQISTVLATVTLAFGLLLITVLLTVSVNQRLGEIAALRALGFSQRRVLADVLSESALLVGAGGILALPLGALLAGWLDRILKTMPGIPVELHFFVFQPRALVIQVTLLVATAILAALYPMRIVARLPIAATLRNEVVS